MHSSANSTTLAESQSATESCQSPPIAGYLAGLGRDAQSSSGVDAFAALRARERASSTVFLVGMLVNALPILWPTKVRMAIPSRSFLLTLLIWDSSMLDSTSEVELACASTAVAPILSPEATMCLHSSSSVLSSVITSPSYPWPPNVIPPFANRMSGPPEATKASWPFPHLPSS